MDLVTTQQRILVMQIYYENGRNIKNSFRKFVLVFTDMDVQQSLKFFWIAYRCEKIGSVKDCRPY